MSVTEHHDLDGNERDVDDQRDSPPLGLVDLMPAPGSPLSPPHSFATYTPGSAGGSGGWSLMHGHEQIITRLVGTHPLWGHHLWNTARVLSDYLVEHKQHVKGKSVLELGAGAALPSLIALLNGAENVTITDYPDQELIDNIQYNVDINIPQDLRRNARIRGFLWGSDVDDILGADSSSFDLILLSDLVFNHSQHAALISSLNSLLSREPVSPDGSPPCVLIFFAHHRPHLADEDMGFLPALAGSGGGWEYEQVVEEWTGVMFEEDRGDPTVRGTVKGFRAWRKQR